MPAAPLDLLMTSERCVSVFIERGTTALTVAEIAAAVGISQRSFYRHFAMKGNTLVPLFEWMSDTVEKVVTAPSTEPLSIVLRRGFDSAFGGRMMDRTRQLFPLVFHDGEMWSVFLRAAHDGEASLGAALAPRLGLPASHTRARLAAAAVATATRIALEDIRNGRRRFHYLLGGPRALRAASPVPRNDC